MTERGWHYRRSLASRITLLTTIAVGLSVAFVALGAFVTVRVQLENTRDASLLKRAHAAARGDLLSEISDKQIPSSLLGAADVRVIFLTLSNGQIQAMSADTGPALTLGAPELRVLTGQAESAVRTITTDDINWRVATVSSGTGEALVIAQSMQTEEEVLTKLGFVMLLFGLAGVVAASLAGWGVARNGLRPVRRLTRSVEQIARTEDLTPLPVEGDDEIARLASAFNQMLVALSASRDRQRQLVSDAGHELRTPLTSLRTNIDLLAQADADGGLPAEARAELLADVRAQAEELTTLMGDLVELAREEPLVHPIELVDLAEVVDRALARVRRRAPGVTFDLVTSPWWVQGDASALERAVANLLDNAVKWSPATGTVTIRLADGELTVDDEGPGIAPEDLPLVFERFYRSVEARSLPGSGLGLSIVRDVAQRHAGSASAGRSPSGGARVTFSVPGTPHRPADDSEHLLPEPRPAAAALVED